MAAVKPLLIFPDAQAGAAGILRTALAGRAEDFAAGATVGTRVPGGRSPETPKLPYVLVRKDTDMPHQSLANTRCTIRITVWHEDADQAHDLAQLCQGLLIVHDGTVLRSVRPGMGPLATTDPDSDIDLSTLTVIANVRPAAA